ncbi:hypothetical protein BB560_002575 [Smittium megazygosporum]|uniref:tRNA:m(4)X modification enzyme TRM13 n=1 Tax=Smittium megazygosporum TaxID=133381 RepID=A0A2T9ZEJ1_9FUNG|nr:hypothetical protein BB560_002575 [Smittium megazygosporum]
MGNNENATIQNSDSLHSNPTKAKNLEGSKVDLPTDEASAQNQNNPSTSTSIPAKRSKARVPCPYDTSHTVDLSKLENHMKNKCNSRPRYLNQPYFKKDFNMTISEPVSKVDSRKKQTESLSLKNSLFDSMKEDGWSCGNAQISVSPGELRYTNSSALFGNLDFINNTTPETPTTEQNPPEKTTDHINKKPRTSCTENQPVEPQSFLQSNLQNFNADTLLERLFSGVNKRIHSDLPDGKLSEYSPASQTCTNIDTLFPNQILDDFKSDDPVVHIPNLKHKSQHSSILGNLKESGLLNPNYRFVEFGCGKGELSRFISDSIGEDSAKTHFILIDRKNFRKKWQGNNQKLEITSQAENTFKEPKDPATNDPFESNAFRIQIDIRDLDLSELSILRKNSMENENQNQIQDWNQKQGSDESNESLYPIVAFSKHLCGAATDLALNCLNNYQNKGGKVVGIFFALCCHHACTYSAYVNPNYIFESLDPVSSLIKDLENNLYPNLNYLENNPTKIILNSNTLNPKNNYLWNENIRSIMKLIFSLSSWATCGWENESSKDTNTECKDTQSRDAKESKKFFSYEPECSNEYKKFGEQISASIINTKTSEYKTNVGKYCKRFLDFGRVEFIKNRMNLKNAKLVMYTNSKASLENIALVAFDTNC